MQILPHPTTLKFSGRFVFRERITQDIRLISPRLKVNGISLKQALANLFTQQGSPVFNHFDVVDCHSGHFLVEGKGFRGGQHPNSGPIRTIYS